MINIEKGCEWALGQTTLINLPAQVEAATKTFTFIVNLDRGLIVLYAIVGRRVSARNGFQTSRHSNQFLFSIYLSQHLPNSHPNTQPPHYPSPQRCQFFSDQMLSLSEGRVLSEQTEYQESF